MVDVRGDVLRPPHGTTPAAVKSNIKSEMRSFKSNENIHKKEGGSYYVVSANKASSPLKSGVGDEMSFGGAGRGKVGYVCVKAGWVLIT